MNTPDLRRTAFLLLLTAVSLAFLAVILPFSGAILWAVTLALLFQPLNQRALRWTRNRATLAALLTLLACLVIVILPVTLVTSSLVAELTALVQKLRGGQMDLRAYYQQIVAALPAWAMDWAYRFDLFNMENLLDKVSHGMLQGGQLVASHALEVGQNTFQFLIQFAVMLYLLFFFLRDGTALGRMLGQAVPLEPSHTRFLMSKFATVLRATVKGNVVIAVIQGVLGGLAFWVLGIGSAMLWGVLMAVLSLLPAVGASLVWGPLAIYLLTTGSVWQGVALVIWGVVVIGLSDNALRPVLVGKDTKLPDYVVLVSTLGGMALFGINGFVIGPTIAAMFMACWALFAQSSQALVER